MWDSACERLAKALHPSPNGAPGETASDLAEALLVAQLSLDAVRAAFEVDLHPARQPPQQRQQQQQRRSRERS